MQRKYRNIIVVVAFLTLASVAFGRSLQSNMEAVVRSANVGQAKVAFHVVDLADGLAVAELHSDEPMLPASNMKLVTTAAALMIFDDDFTFKTQMQWYDGKLIIVGEGDPAFGDPRILGAMGMNIEDLLARWVSVVKKAGITNIDSIVIDDRAFDSQHVHPNWPEDQLERWYCAPVTGLNFNDNCLDIYVRPSSPGLSQIIQTRPIDAPVILTNLTKAGSKNAIWPERQMGTNRITVRGTVRHAYKAPIYVTLHDPPMVFGNTLRDRLKKAGIEVGNVRRIDEQETFDEARLLAEVKTPLAEIIKRCNMDSQNLFAESLIKRIGRQATGDPGSWTNGAAAIRMFLSKLLGPDASAIVIDDGSGLSRRNRVTASLLAGLLFEMNAAEAERDDDLPTPGDILRQSLPVAGKTGTLARRFRTPALKATVHAKSGYIKHTLALSGYIQNENSQYAFSILLNDYTKPVYKGHQLIEQLVHAIDDYMYSLNRSTVTEPAFGG